MTDCFLQRLRSLLFLMLECFYFFRPTAEFKLVGRYFPSQYMFFMSLFSKISTKSLPTNSRWVLPRLLSNTYFEYLLLKIETRIPSIQSWGTVAPSQTKWLSRRKQPIKTLQFYWHAINPGTLSILICLMVNFTFWRVGKFNSFCGKFSLAVSSTWMH